MGELTIASIPGERSLTALTITTHHSQEEYQAALNLLMQMTTSVQWWVGDLLCRAEQDLGPDAVGNLIEPRAASTMKNWLWVASKIDPSRRREKVSHSIHAEVAGKDPTVQDEVLLLAEQGGWTKQEVRHHLNPTKTPTNEPFKCPACGHTGHKIDFLPPQ